MGRRVNTLKLSAAGVIGYAAQKLSPYLARQFVARTIGNMPGVPAKISQLLCSRMNAETSAVRISALSLPVVRQMIAKDSPALHRDLADLSADAIVGSIGQVHRGMLRDGRMIAVKVRYPDLENNIEEQIDAVMNMAAKSPAARYGMDLESYRNFFKQSLQLELDFSQEAATQKHFRKALVALGGVIIPEVLDEYSSRSVLCQIYEDSARFSELSGKCSSSDADHIAETVIALVAKMIFETGMLHTDPHEENLGWRRNEETNRIELVLYDFGSFICIPREHQMMLAQLLTVTREGQHPISSELLIRMGFSRENLAPLSNRLAPLCRELLHCWVSDKPFSFAHDDMSGKIRDILGDDSWWFRSAGPPWFLYLMRSISSFAASMSCLPRSNITPWSLIKPELSQLDLESSEICVDPEQTDPDSHQKTVLASHLSVRVTKEGSTVVSVTLPATAVDRLEDLVGDDVKLCLQDRNINLEAIKQCAIRSSYEPQVLFKEDLGTKSYMVSLE